MSFHPGYGDLIVCPESSARDPDIVAFRDWVLAEAAASVALVKIPEI
ncbi:MAG: hypothetical protein HY526_08455 [Betaproteobacteria bacterium]|nr:hypothetical protein [Betaproteobacteria bacterium]